MSQMKCRLIFPNPLLIFLQNNHPSIQTHHYLHCGKICSVLSAVKLMAQDTLILRSYAFQNEHETSPNNTGPYLSHPADHIVSKSTLFLKLTFFIGSNFTRIRVQGNMDFQIFLPPPLNQLFDCHHIPCLRQLSNFNAPRHHAGKTSLTCPHCK